MEIKKSRRVSEKEVLAKRVVELSKGINSTIELKQILELNHIKTYDRNGILTGIWNDKGTRKYRLRKLGIEIQDLNRILSREQEKKRSWSKKRNRSH